MPSPSDYSNESDFVSACIAQRQDEHPGEDQDQSAAICYSMWGEKKMKAVDETPYGNVEYADPGFQSDGKKRYPVDTEDHIRAAWTYINQERNQSPYTADQIAHIKNKIIAAWKKKIDAAGPPSAKMVKQCFPFPGEDQEEFMSRCIDETGDAEECMTAWDDSEGWRSGGKKPVFKTHASETVGMEFVLSDETVDRYQDVIAADGWSLENFKKNPIALFNHNSDFPVGKWKNLRVVNGALRGHLEMAPEGTSARIDEIRKLIEAGILKAVSVGFHPIESKPRSKSAPGTFYAKSELVETSLVSIPANPNALAVAKSMGISGDTMNLVFAKHGDETVRRSASATASKPKPDAINRKTLNMSPISNRIVEAEKRIVGLKDQLTQHLANVDDANPTDESTTITEDLTQKIEQQERSLEVLKKAESHIAATAKAETTTFEDGSSSKVEVRTNRPFAMAAKQVKPLDLYFRSMAIAAKHHGSRGRKPMIDILKENYGEDDKTRAVMEYVTRTDAAPAMTTTSGWVSQLVQTVVAELVESLMPVSVYPKLAAQGTTYAFSANGGAITLPSRTTGNLAGGFVAEGAGIPVKQGAFTSVSLTPKKLAVITTFTRESAAYSAISLETILRQAILEDTGVAIDTAFFANQAATTTVPQGLQSLAVAALTAATGSAAVDLIADLKAIVGDLITTTSGNFRKPVWIMNPASALSAALSSSTGGTLLFRDELSNDKLLGIPVIKSTAAGTGLYLVDAADFSTAQGAPRFDVSDSAVLVMTDAGDAMVAATGGTAVAADPMRSLYQTDTLAIRMIWPLDWAWRRANVCAYLVPNWD